MRSGSKSQFVLGLAGLVAAICVATASGATNPATRYVLTLRDVGAPYAKDALASGRRTFADVSVDNSKRVQEELRRNWLGGTVAAFRDFSGQSSVISIADVFRSPRGLGAVLRAWQQDAVRTTHGVLEELPPKYPGQHPALVRGTVANYEILLYMWSRGQKIASVALTGKPGQPRRGLLLRLARQQDAKLRAT